MNKLSQRVALALPSSKPYKPTSASYTTSAVRATRELSSSNAPNRTRAGISYIPGIIAPRQFTPPNIYTPARTMSSDAEYAAFLDKANQDVAPAEQQDLSKKGYGTKSVNTAVPKVLESIEEYYVSDADEPFEPVALEFDGDSVSASGLKKLLGKDKAEEVKEKGFETQYKNVFNAVKKAGNGEVKVFKVDLEGTRAEYYVVSVDQEGKKIVGLKALSVES